MRIARDCPCCGGTDLARSAAVLMPFLAARIFGWESVEVTEAWGLRDLAPGRAYGLCASLACGSCCLLFLDMRFDDDEMAALYADYRGPAYEAERERFEPGYGLRNAILNRGATHVPVIEAILAPHLPVAPRVLDWGGDIGLNTPFRGRCALHHVLEISGKPPVAGAVRVDPEAVGQQAYDLVVCAHVLEHVPQPRRLVRAITRALGPETLLYVEVPHEELVRLEPDPAARLLRKRHWHEHVNFFTESALHALLAAEGLAVVACLSHPVEGGGRIGHVFSVLARRSDHPNGSPGPG